MYRDDSLERCFNFVRDGMWDWFLTLKYPQTITPKYKWVRYGHPDEAFKVWIDEMTCEHGLTIPYVRVIERRDDGDVLYHVLLRDIPEGFWQRHWRWRWYEFTAGAAWNRRLDAGIERLIKYFFYRLHWDVEYSDYGDATLCEAADDAR
jgi:hypothetical protein